MRNTLTKLVFLHGAGGADSLKRWLDPLNARLAELGYPSLRESSGDTLIAPSYVVAKDDNVTEPPITFKPAKDQALLRQTLDFTARQKELERFVRTFADKCGPGLGSLGPVVEPLAEAVEFVRFPEVSCYMAEKTARYSAWRQVLKQMPDDGRVIVVAHSLGSVVMADLLRRLPEGLTVDLLITIGSPLAFSRYRANSGLSKSTFPHERVKRWLNVAAPLDGVCGGRGISAAIPQVIDIHADLSFSHAATGYMSHPAVAAAIGYVAFNGAPRQSSDPGPTPGSPARRIHDSWDPLLLGTAFSLQVSNGLPTSRWADKARLDMARHEVAKRVLSDIDSQRSLRAEQLDDLRKMGAEFEPSRLDDNPLGDGRCPDYHSLTHGAAALLSGKWSDKQLLSLSVGLMLSPIVPPFDVRVNTDARHEALEQTLNLIRARRGNLPDKAYARQVRESVEWAEGRLAGSGFPWGTVLITSGIVLLAATGVGLAVAAPAGLAGAAVVTSTLAGFGPGGMVGGLIALGVLTGTGASLTSLGVADVLGDGGEVSRHEQAVHSASEIVAASPDALTVTLTGMLAVVRAQLQLSFESSEALVRLTVTNALDIARAEWLMHSEIAPDGRSTKDWEAKVTRLQRALDALDSLESVETTATLVQARKAIESGRAPEGGVSG
jgi:pimeloyl-ACP methyl ester carboxylesterase